MSKAQYVYVVGFTPAVDSGNSAGGFDWYYKFKDAVRAMKVRMKEGKGYNLTLIKFRPDTALTDALSIQRCVLNHPEFYETKVQDDLEEGT